MNKEDAVAALKRWQDMIADEFASKALSDAVQFAIEELSR
jgi:hypothetical protein